MMKKSFKTSALMLSLLISTAVLTTPSVSASGAKATITYNYVTTSELSADEKKLITEHLPKMVAQDATYYLVYKPTGKILPKTGSTDTAVAALVGVGLLVIGISLGKKNKKIVTSITLISLAGVTLLPSVSALQMVQLAQHSYSQVLTIGSELPSGKKVIDGYEFVGYIDAATLSIESTPASSKQVLSGSSTQPSSSTSSSSTTSSTTIPSSNTKPSTTPTMATTYKPKARQQVVAVNGKPDAQAAVGNHADLPVGTTYSWSVSVDTTVAGKKIGVVTVTYPDKSTDVLSVEVEVLAPTKPSTTPSSSSSSSTTKPSSTSSSSSSSTTKPSTTPSSSSSSSTTKPSSTTGSSSSNTTKPSVIKTMAETYAPQAKSQTVAFKVAASAEAGIDNKSLLPSGTVYSWKSAVDTSTAGQKTGIVLITYPDKSVDELSVTVIVEAPKETSAELNVSLGTGTVKSITVNLTQTTVKNEALTGLYNLRKDMYARNPKFNGQPLQDYLRAKGITSSEQYATLPKWDDALERIAIQRAVETGVHKKYSHIRVNGEAPLEAVDQATGTRMQSEIIQWGYGMTDALTQSNAFAYGELNALNDVNGYSNNNNGHLHTLLDPDYRYYGFASIGRPDFPYGRVTLGVASSTTRTTSNGSGLDGTYTVTYAE